MTESYLKTIYALFIYYKFREVCNKEYFDKCGNILLLIYYLYWLSLS